MTVSVSLPFPPSTNNLFSTRRGRRVPSESYRKWRDAARLELIVQRPAKVPGRFEAEMLFERPDRRARDLDNHIKAPLDALVHAGILEDDSLSRRLVQEWAGDEPVKGARVLITIRSAA